MFSDAVTHEIDLPGVSFHDLAEYCSGRPGFALLDTCGGQGDLSLFSYSPFATVSSGPGEGVAPLRERLGRQSGAAIGYFTYEFACRFGFYNFAILHSRRDNRVLLRHTQPAGEPSALTAGTVLQHLLEVEPVPGHDKSPFAEAIEAEMSEDTYLDAVRRIREYIYAGDVYQVNMTQRFTAKLNNRSPWQLYKRLMELNPAPYSAFLNFEDTAVVSSSPELFLRVEDGLVETRPIKGTIRRGRTPAEDAALRDDLLASQKNRAELAMIVDLLRNDLGRVCRPGTVVVKEFPALESYASLHHLVATVTGRLEAGRDALDLVEAAFPGGSITGAPKIRAMEIIRELEPGARGVYTGSIGYLGSDGSANLNIAIRTIVVQDGIAYMSSGGGIVADSDFREEYQESLLKASLLFEAIRTA